jgi:hypothetical protein
MKGSGLRACLAVVVEPGRQRQPVEKADRERADLLARRFDRCL